MDAGITKAAAAGAEVAGPLLHVVEGPRFAFVVTEDETALTRVIGDHQGAIGEADDLIAKLTHGLHDGGFRPGDAVVFRSADDVLIATTGEMKQRLLAIPPDFRTMIIHIRAVPEG